MKKSILVLATALFLFAGTTTVLTSCGSNDEAKKHEHTEVAVNDIYACPMQCEGDKTYDKEGNCPVCSMALTSTKDDESHEGHNH